jgi:hypothetical protein
MNITLLGYKALASIEQLIRAWASAKGWRPIKAADPGPSGPQSSWTHCKARKAFAHGAVTATTDKNLDCIGNLVVKSIRALIGAGVHQMTGVAAYHPLAENRQQPATCGTET